MYLDESSDVSGDMTTGFTFLWRWHVANMNAAISGQSLEQVPAILRLLANSERH